MADFTTTLNMEETDISCFSPTLSALCVQVGRTPLMAAAQDESVDTAQLLAKYSKKKNHLDTVGV